MGGKSTEIFLTVMPVFRCLRKNCSLAGINQVSAAVPLPDHPYNTDKTFFSLSLSPSIVNQAFFPQEVLLPAEKCAEKEIYFSEEE